MLQGVSERYNTFISKIHPDTYHWLRLSLYSVMILIFHTSSAILLQKIYKTPYLRTNQSNSQQVVQDNFSNPFATLIFDELFGFLYGFSIYYIFSSNNSENNQNEIVPSFQFIRMAGIEVFHILAANFFVVKTSYLLVNMINSSQLIAVVIISVFCTQASSRYRVESRQIFIALLMCSGIIIFNYFNEKKDGNDENNWIAILILLFSLILYSLKPELASRVREKYRIEGNYMYYQISKFLLILGIIGSVISNQLLPLAKFMWQHDRISLDLALHSLLNMVGCIFVYQVTIIYKQHVVPFVICVRKLLSSFLSIYYFNNQINNLQYVGMGIVFVSILLEIGLSIRQSQQNQPDKPDQQNQQNQQNQDKLNPQQLNKKQIK